MFRQVNTTNEHNKLVTLLLDKMRKKLEMSTLLLTTSDSCGVPYPRVTTRGHDRYSRNTHLHNCFKTTTATSADTRISAQNVRNSLAQG